MQTIQECIEIPFQVTNYVKCLNNLDSYDWYFPNNQEKLGVCVFIHMLIIKITSFHIYLFFTKCEL